MTIKQAAQTAIDCQDAVNLPGVLASFKEIVHEVLWPEARRLGRGTDYVNQHPIVALFLDKLVDLSRYGRQDNVWSGEGNAYDAVKAIAAGDNITVVTVSDDPEPQRANDSLLLRRGSKDGC